MSEPRAGRDDRETPASRVSDAGGMLLVALGIVVILALVGGGLFLFGQQRQMAAAQMEAMMVAREAAAQAQRAAQSGQSTAVTVTLQRFIEDELAAKDLGALSIALVNGKDITWAEGFGLANPKTKTPATKDTVYRVGSVSKLFTDIGIMQLVEKGELDLERPVSDYLPDFKPSNPFGKPVTLRQLMAHRSGLVREPPVGHYFDPDNPSLEKTVESLRRTELVYPPEEKIKYSNAAIATVGYVLEKTQGQPFPQYLSRAVLEPMGLKQSAFEETPDVRRQLATAFMWTYPGRRFEAPTFPLGMAPAGSMYSTVGDLGKFLTILFAGGHGPNGPVLRKETLEEMWKPQFAKPEDKTGFGIGFMVGELEGKRRIGHGGAIYGFATELAALPDEKLGVVVVTSVDGANGVTQRIANQALRLMLAAKQNKPLPKIEESKPVPPDLSRRVAGRYGTGDKAVDLIESNGRLFMLPVRGGFRLELKKLGDDLIVDDPLEYGRKLKVDGDTVVIGKDTLARQTLPRPAPPPEHWAGLIGEYGWDHNVLYILEKEGQLHALIEWFFLYPLKELGPNKYQFPDFGLYHGEKMIFLRDENGRGKEVDAASVLFKRRPLQGEDGSTFRITPLRPVAELRREALAAQPPKEAGQFLKPDLVELTALDPTIKLDLRYATTNNFLGTALYTTAKAFLQRPAAEAVVRVHKGLEKQGYGLLIHDAYRPWHVTKMFWEATPEKDRIFVANPADGSRHNRGSAVDLTLFDLKTGKPVQMVAGFDEMADRSYPDYLGGTSLQRWHRDLLRRAMEAEGFTIYEAEWWHFDYKDWRRYPILNLTLEEVAAGKGS